MGNIWTEEQKQAISTRGCDLLVAAAAGSGKTAVLVERIISMVTEDENPIDIDKLLVVTFTKAAASEMSQRIGDAIHKKLEENPSNIHLQNQLTLLNRADIKTIHSFCLQVIKENYYAVDIDPAARTADTAEIKLLQNEVLEDLFEDWYTKEDNESFCNLVECFGNATKDKKLKELILQVYHFIQGCPNPLKWLEEMTESLQLKLEDTAWISMIWESIALETEAACFQLMQGYKKAAATVGFEGYESTLEKEVEMLEEFRGKLSGSLEEVYNAYAKVKFGRLSPYKGEETELAAEIKNLRDSSKKTMAAVGEKYFLYRPELMRKHLSLLYPFARTIFELVQEFTERFQRAKREKQILDFNDYEHFCMQVLLEEKEDGTMIPTTAALLLQEKYAEVMIDEYQDSNMIQELILSSVSKKSQGKQNRFMVGDVKQSIYRFRLAMPEIFMEKYNTYPNVFGGQEQKIVLSQNFRSRENVLEGINFLFRQIMSEKVGEMIYDDEAALYTGMKFPKTELPCGGDNEIFIIDSAETENAEYEMPEELEEMSRREIEAVVIAQRIKKLMKEEHFHVLDKITGEYRPLEFRDITILMRSTRPWAGVFDKIFMREGIPFYAELTLGYFDTPEVVTVLNFLQIIDNPRQDIPLISVLFSPVYHFSADSLMEIRLMGGQEKLSYYECMQLYLEGYQVGMPNIDIEIGEKLAEFFSDLQQWREKAVYEPISVLLWDLYESTGYFDYVGITAGGEIRQANLRLLIEKAQQYENTSFKGLFHFVKYIENMKGASEDSNSAKVLNENENLVKIMTIHKSKGLEFPVVFVSDMGKEFNKTDTRADIILHQKLGIGFHYMDLEQRAVYNTLIKTALAEKIKSENLSEEMRVLYVALTRAKEKLILTGTCKKMQKKMQGWFAVADNRGERLPEFAMGRANHYLDWVMPALLRHPNTADFVSGWLDTQFTEGCTFADEVSRWQMYLVSKEEILLEQYEEKETITEVQADFKHWNSTIDYSGQKDKIMQQLQWEYPHKMAAMMPAKVSVSEIKRRQFAEFIEMTEGNYVQQEWNPIFPKLNFEQETVKLTGTQVGTAIHTFMEHCDFRKEYDTNEIAEIIQSMVQSGILLEEEGRTIDKNAVLSFFQSPLGMRLRKAEKIEKERPFAITISPKDAHFGEKFQELEETVLINGIIDCYFYEDGQIVLLDYKNDKVYNDDESLFRKKYGIQLQIYRQALEKVTGKRVKESYIYSFALKKAILM